jgi:hypothetical protein
MLRSGTTPDARAGIGGHCGDQANLEGDADLALEPCGREVVRRSAMAQAFCVRRLKSRGFSAGAR